MSFWILARKPNIVRNAIKISLAVGTLLNVINQGEALWSDRPVDWLHLALNYVVPYCVATYSAVRNEMSRGAAR